MTCLTRLDLLQLTSIKSQKEYGLERNKNTIIIITTIINECEI